MISLNRSLRPVFDFYYFKSSSCWKTSLLHPAGSTSRPPLINNILIYIIGWSRLVGTWNRCLSSLVCRGRTCSLVRTLGPWICCIACSHSTHTSGSLSKKHSHTLTLSSTTIPMMRYVYTDLKVSPESIVNLNLQPNSN